MSRAIDKFNFSQAFSGHSSCHQSRNAQVRSSHISSHQYRGYGLTTLATLGSTVPQRLDRLFERTYSIPTCRVAKLESMPGDVQDWTRYRVNRFVDCDMVMRYHWGLAAGHTYAHGAMSEPEMPTNIPTSIEEPETSFETVTDVHMMEENRDDDDDPELGFENRQDDLIEDAANSDGDASGPRMIIEDAMNVDESEDEVLAIDNMYGPAYD